MLSAYRHTASLKSIIFSCLLASLHIQALPTPGNHASTSFANSRTATLPIQRRVRHRSSRDKRGGLGAIGLGDQQDLAYSAAIQIGGTTVDVSLDTGSSDLFVITDACQTATCTQSSATKLAASSLTYASPPATANLQFGDSTTGTHATGPVASNDVSLAGIDMSKQYFAAINDTNNSVIQDGFSGLLGLGFFSESVVQAGAAGVLGANGSPTSPSTDTFVNAASSAGPLVSRMAQDGLLDQPMFTMTLQRTTVDLSPASAGQITLGGLPDGVDNSSLTWVPVRLYKPTDGGLMPPSFAPDETYPLRWEVPLDAVFLDGQQLPQSTLGGADGGIVSALIDSGNSILRGPADLVSTITSSVSSSTPTTSNSKSSNGGKASSGDGNGRGGRHRQSGRATTQGTFPCTSPHTLAFQIGGQMFPVDPRDFASPSTQKGNTDTCDTSNIVSTDPPAVGALFSWSLGDVFLKSNLVSFYYGNLTHPSVDPPRIGFKSLVPSNADQLLAQAVQSASANGGFPSSAQAAPTATIALTQEPVPLSAPTGAPLANGNAQSAPGAGATSTTSVAAQGAGATNQANAKSSSGALSTMRSAAGAGWMTSAISSLLFAMFVHAAL